MSTQEAFASMKDAGTALSDVAVAMEQAAQQLRQVSSDLMAARATPWQVYKLIDAYVKAVGPGSRVRFAKAITQAHSALHDLGVAYQREAEEGLETGGLAQLRALEALNGEKLK